MSWFCPQTLLLFIQDFYASILQHVILDEPHMHWWDSIQLEEMFTFMQEPFLILSRDVSWLPHREISVVMVQWRNLLFKEAKKEKKSDIWVSLADLQFMMAHNNFCQQVTRTIAQIYSNGKSWQEIHQKGGMGGSTQ